MTDGPIAPHAPSQARMIAGPDSTPFDRAPDMRQPPVFLREFDHPLHSSHPTIASARLILSAWGLVECEINGHRVGRDVLTPGWTVYGTRLPYWTYDVTDLIADGRNAMTFWLGDGWYRGRIGFGGGERDCYGDRLGLIAQLEIVDADGGTTVIASNAEDGLWRTTNGPILASGLYEGETYDAREALPGFGLPLDGAVPDVTGTVRWQPVEELDFDPSVLYPADESTAVREIGERHLPAGSAITRLADGRWLVDFGQNCTQRVVLRIPEGLTAGAEITIQHVEVLNPDGSPATRPLRRAVQRDHYIASGQEGDATQSWWEPRFTMHGFRYACISGWPEDRPLTADDLFTRVYSSARRPLGDFSCSLDRVNRLHENVRWSMLSNFVSIPTDCPQRDERFGWTGDIAVFTPTAAYLYDVTGFLDSWLDDVAIETDKWGTVPYYVPYPSPGWGKPVAVALWGDAVVMVPWALYMATGDASILRRHLPLARRWMDEVAGLLSDDGVWDRRPEVWCGQLGDWLDPTAPPDDAARAMTEKNLVATAFAANSAKLVAQILDVVGDPQAAAHYEQLAAHIRDGFRRRFVLPDGRMTSDTQCAYALLIALDLLEDDATDRDRLREIAGDRLAELVREREYVVGTGFAGTPYVLGALCATGHAREAFSLFLSDHCPSWLYQVRMGATTTWERWDSMLPNGEVNPGDMTSFNHYALGAVADWMHTAIGGLEIAEPGWRTVRVAPLIAEAVRHGIRSGAASHKVPSGGTIAVSWTMDDNDSCRLDVTVPEGVRATLDPGLGELDDELDDDIVDEDTHEAVTAGTTLETGEHRFSLYTSVDSRATSV
ncbi:alpha-L-rhamnosidase [Bifidobacterium callitrichos]|uniref:alpha-L-rhamnosidase n=1 Tax=Bifidobacterium callitrichos TaxID=762209 RepID=A0A2T3G8B0_9BIFI|nr:alpha-L-rhamnosidase [Bifidobacterium callitrichos]PST45692.1 alpha-L-rhamnosidase [Bifidobacterium callitrichos]